MDAQKPFWKALFHGLLHMLAIAVLVDTCQAHVHGHQHKRVDRSSFPINQVSSLYSPGLNRREMQTIVLTTTISTYIELGIPCAATEIPQSMSSLLTRPPPLSIPTSLGSIATGGSSVTAPNGGSPALSQTSTLSSTSATDEPNSSSSKSLSSSQTSSPSSTGTQSSTINHTSTADSPSAPSVPDTSTAAPRSTTEPAKSATSTSTTNIPSSTHSVSPGTSESSVALSSSTSTRSITTVVVSSTIVVFWPGTESTSSVADSTTSASSKTKHTAWVTQTSQETVTEWTQPSSFSSSSSSTSFSSSSSSSSNSTRTEHTAWVTKTAEATVTQWFDPPAVAPSSSSSTSTTPGGPAAVVVTASAQATVTQFHDSTQTIIVSPIHTSFPSAPPAPDVVPRLPADSNLPGPTKRIVRFTQRIWYTENKHQIMVIATYEDNHVVTVYAVPDRTDMPAVLVLDDQNGNKRGSLKMTFRMGFFTIEFRSEMAGRVTEWENHWTKNDADEDAPWCETVFLKNDGKERLAREVWCYYTA
ncbi:hypothetical protein CcaCcLH18_05068 [Colletotrichum camelliae]|nr:hypothetical protein CcaCcLH18_05068 [Colletotrichum camelliae]